MSKVIVAVRVRPMNQREIEIGCNCVIDMTPQQTTLKSNKKGTKNFAYDHCFWSMDDKNPKHRNQEAVFEALGRDVLENAFQGYNACVFAYGQTGSGKSYTMMGAPGQKGIIPRLCDSLFERISSNDDTRLTFKVEVSYMEIYNEKVRDLLDPRRQKQSLKVREHQSLGPYVDGLSKLAVKSFADIESLMIEGNKSRTVASTNMNSESSRSHAVFTVVMTQTMFDPETQAGHEKVSRISLVDLAGSERAGKSGAEGDRLREGSNINKSLTTLGLVISNLADQSAGKSKKGTFIPYRDSVLTWLLKDNLGGNSKTVMVATVSPAEDNYEETLSTLRYADRAKRIVNNAIVNEDPNAKVIRELREELDRLRSMLSGGQMPGGVGSEVDQKEVDNLKEKLAISERLMNSITMTWEEKLAETERIHHKRQEALEEMGISIQASGIGVESGKFYLVNLNADPSLNELLVYYLRPYMRVGRKDGVPPPDIRLQGLGIHPQHCVLETEDRDLYVTPEKNAQTFINGCLVTERTLLYQGDRILWGNNHFFRVSCDRKRESTGGEENVPMDYESAKKEVSMNEMLRTNVDDVVKSLEEKHIADKQGALDEQRMMYEKKLEELRGQMQSTVKRDSTSPPATPATPGSARGSRLDLLSDEEEELYNEEDLRRLKENMLSAMEMVREANCLSSEMDKDVKFKVSLQIRREFLSPRRKGAPKRKRPNEVVIALNYAKNKSRNTTWSVDKLEDKLVDMRDMYQRLQDGALKDELEMNDPFYDQDSHVLIGVANLFLECLHHEVELEYSPPIIDQKGEICGRLDVKIKRHQSFDLTDDMTDFVLLGNTPRMNGDDSYWTIQVSVVEASGLPQEWCKYVFCQYDFFNHKQVIVSPLRDSNGVAIVRRQKVIFENDHIFPVVATDDFVDYIAYDCIRFEVYGNRSIGFSEALVQPRALKNRSLSERWSEVLKRFEMIVEVMELNETGEYAPVQLVERPDNRTGGIFLLKQGQSRRIHVVINAVKGSGSGPVAFEAVEKIAVGAVVHQNKQAISLDSYTDIGLEKLREKWSSALMKRRAFLDEQIHRIVDKSDRSKDDMERESELIDEWTLLQWERQAVTQPMPGTGVPGSPSVRNKHLGPAMETKVTSVFLDLTEETISLGELAVIADDYLLDGEDDESMIDLPIVKTSDKQIAAVASWDSSQHDNVHLNKATNDRDRVYLVLKMTARLSHPLPVRLVLRKRICVKIYKKSGLGIASVLKQKFVRSDKRVRCGAVYEIAAGIPKQAGMDRPASPDPEQMLAAEEEEEENVLDRVSHGVSSVISILSLDRLRQEVAVKERLADLGRPLKKLPPPMTIKPLSSLSRADSGTLYEDTEETPSSQLNLRGLRVPSPGVLASAISKISDSNSLTPSAADPTHKPVRRLISLAREEEKEKEKEVETNQEDQSLGSLAEDTKEDDEGSGDCSAEKEVEESIAKEDAERAVEPEEETKVKEEEEQEAQSSTPPLLKVEDLVEEQEEKISDMTSETATVAVRDESSTTDVQGACAATEEESKAAESANSEPPVEEVPKVSEPEESSVEVSVTTEETPPTEVEQLSAEPGALKNADIEVKETGDSRENRAEETPSPSAVAPSEQAQAEKETEREETSVAVASEEAEEPSTSANQTEAPSPSVVETEREQPSPKLETEKIEVEKPSPQPSSLSSSTSPPVRPSSAKSEEGSIALTESNESDIERPTAAVAAAAPAASSNPKKEITSLPVDSEPEKPQVVLKVGEIVMVDMARGYKMGTVKYVGETQFQPGQWIGVALDTPHGKHNGTVKEVVYFKCRPKHGVFVRSDKIVKAPDLSSSPKPPPKSSSKHSPTPPRRTSLPSTNSSRLKGSGMKSKFSASALKK
ncbi:kinesin-like protein KIF13A isoform X2 [Oscarella lobularis]|uniref:kinesin-like protein KIF13A isoform X2 n=1 Tax=Oscarella lobularis TaxID=121494 RepID=UPI0033138E1C